MQASLAGRFHDLKVVPFSHHFLPDLPQDKVMQDAPACTYASGQRLKLLAMCAW